jgi:magnesium-transporting ATPase (P-type)
MGPPPAYERVVNRISLRPVLLFTTLVSTIYLLVLGVYSLRSISLSNQTVKIKILDVVVGVLLIVAAIIEIFGFLAAWTSRLPLAKIYARISTLALLLVVGADLTEIITHFTNKTDLISGCTIRNTGESSSSNTWSIFGQDSDDDDEPMTAEEAGIYCEELWKKQSLWEFIWYVPLDPEQVTW